MSHDLSRMCPNGGQSLRREGRHSQFTQTRDQIWETSGDGSQRQVSANAGKERGCVPGGPGVGYVSCGRDSNRPYGRLRASHEGITSIWTRMGLAPQHQTLRMLVDAARRRRLSS
jgi:hypothetical protein